MECKNDGTHHFSEPLQREFQSGGLHPLAHGTFGETNDKKDHK